MQHDDQRLIVVADLPADDGVDDRVADRVTPEQVWSHPRVQAYVRVANDSLRQIGYTEHGQRHASVVARSAAELLRQLGWSPRQCELVAIAGLLHDIGNLVNRQNHGQIGALLAHDVLFALGMPIDETVTIMGAIGNHEEERGHAISPVAAALILADKADVHRSRVHNPDPAGFDIHDRVNHATTRSVLHVDHESHTLTLTLTIDTAIASVMDYFEIFLSRMLRCRRAAEYLGCRFSLVINGVQLL